MNKLNQFLLSIVFLVGIAVGIQFVYVSSFTEREVNLDNYGTLFYVRENIWTGKKCITERFDPTSDKFYSQFEYIIDSLSKLNNLFI